MLEVNLEFNKGILFARLNGDLVREQVIKINNKLLNFIINNQVRYLVYNLYNLNKIDASGINAILNTKYVISHNNGNICFCETPDNLKKLFKKMRINMVTDELCAINYMRDIYEI